MMSHFWKKRLKVAFCYNCFCCCCCYIHIYNETSSHLSTMQDQHKNIMKTVAHRISVGIKFYLKCNGDMLYLYKPSPTPHNRHRHPPIREISLPQCRVSQTSICTNILAAKLDRWCLGTRPGRLC